jgi:FK506-binding protein 4/5
VQIFFCQVLEIGSCNVKALYRRAQAYGELYDLELAKADVLKALELDPNNK